MENEQAQIMDDLKRILSGGYGTYDSRFHQPSFKCPHFECKALAEMTWYPCSIRIYVKDESALVAGAIKTAERKTTSVLHSMYKGLYLSICRACNRPSIWFEGWLRFPEQLVRDVPEPNKAVTNDVLKDYLEAGSILAKSPRGAAALLRLAIEKLINEIEPGTGDINAKIGILVTKGLRREIQMALDTVRVIGNEAVHPGQIDLRDNPNIAQSLFVLVNRIAEDLITSKNEIADLYGKLPPEKRQGIENRDKPKNEGGSSVTTQ